MFQPWGHRHTRPTSAYIPWLVPGTVQTASRPVEGTILRHFRRSVANVDTSFFHSSILSIVSSEHDFLSTFSGVCTVAETHISNVAFMICLSFSLVYLDFYLFRRRGSGRRWFASGVVSGLFGCQYKKICDKNNSNFFFIIITFNVVSGCDQGDIQPRLRPVRYGTWWRCHVHDQQDVRCKLWASRLFQSASHKEIL